MSDLVSILKQAGFKGDGLRTAYAIAMRESGGRASAFNPNRSTGDQSYGLFQINMLGDLGPARRKQYGLASNEALFDPLTNAKVAYRMSKGGTDFGAWGLGPNAYRSGAGFDTIKKFYDTFPGGAGSSPTTPVSSPPPAPTVATGDLGSFFSDALRSGQWSLGRSSLADTLRLVGQFRQQQQVVPEVASGNATVRTPAGTTVRLKAGGGWGGSYNLASSLAGIGRRTGLSVTSEKRDRKMTASGGVSDHWVGSKWSYAYDVSGSPKRMDAAARKILARLGIPWDGKSPIVLNKVVGKHRVQILYRTDVGGNHHDHIHIGVRRVA